MKKLLLISLLCVVTTANADDDLNWTVSGFGTFGFAGTDTDSLGFYRDRSQADDLTNSWGLTTDSRLGLQVDGDITKSLHTTVQWVARDHVGDFIEQNLEWAFLRWNISNETTLRLGRLGLESFLLSDYRNVGYAYPWMRPPHEFYAPLSTYHFDGMDMTEKMSLGKDGHLLFKLFGGYSFTQIATDTPKTFDLKAPITGTSLVYESGSWKVRAGYTYMYMASELPNRELVDAINDPVVNQVIPGIKQYSPYLSLKDTSVHFYTLGSAYDDGTWLAQAEASYTKQTSLIAPDILAAYLSLGRRFSSVTLYSLFGISENFRNNVTVPQPLLPIPELQQLQQAVELGINNSYTNEKSVSLGLRWDFYDNMAFKTQWSYFSFNGDGRYLWQRPLVGNPPDNVNVWSFGVDFVF